MKKFFFTLFGMAFFIACNNSKNETQTQPVKNDTLAQSADFTVAVVNVDSILLNYKFAVQANETLMKKSENARLVLNTKARQLRNEMEDFQKKIDNNAFLSRERAEQEAQRLQKKQTDLQEHEQKLSYEISVEQQNLGVQLQDSINLAINQLNKSKQFTLVLSTSSMNNNVLFVAENYNITDEVLAFLNSRCK
jgi:outer membrane protein